MRHLGIGLGSVLLLAVSLMMPQSPASQRMHSDQTKATGKSDRESPYKKYIEGAMDAFSRQDYNLARKLILEFQRLGEPLRPDDQDGPCSPEEEYSQLQHALQCITSKQFAQKHWSNFNKARNDVLLYLKKGSGKELIPYISCSAVNLTQYEFLCWNDDTIGARAFEYVLAELKAEPRLYTRASWRRTEKEHLRPPWIDEWVLYPQGLRLVEPCDIGKRGIIALGKRKDGKIYISGYAADCMIRWVIMEAYKEQ